MSRLIASALLGVTMDQKKRSKFKSLISPDALQNVDKKHRSLVHIHHCYSYLTVKLNSISIVHSFNPQTQVSHLHLMGKPFIYLKKIHITAYRLLTHFALKLELISNELSLTF